jgi:hypothetical protein
VSDDGSIDTYNIPAVRDHTLPPGILDSAPKLNTHGAIVPKTVDTTVDFAALKDKTASLTHRDQIVHLNHKNHLIYKYLQSDGVIIMPARERQGYWSGLRKLSADIKRPSILWGYRGPKELLMSAGLVDFAQLSHIWAKLVEEDVTFRQGDDSLIGAISNHYGP